VLRDYRGGLGNLVVDPLALEEDNPPTVYREWLQPRNEPLECLDCSGSNDSEGLLFRVVICSACENGHVVQVEFSNLFTQPSRSTLERFDEHEVAVRSKNSENDAG
jgi:hypothetical protein